MPKNELDQLLFDYQCLLERQDFDPESLDYQVFERWVPLLDQFSRMDNSGITVFDHFKKQHIYSSYNFKNILGYRREQVLNSAFFDTRIHPEDYLTLVKNGIELLQFCFRLPIAERCDYKLVREYRIRNHQDQYLNIIEQQKVLELDQRGNLWLSISILDISPNQRLNKQPVYQLVHIHTGENFTLESRDDQENIQHVLSKREKEILGLVTQGKLSKEISDQLNISVHTVNNHRQNILQKLNANNTLEAVKMAESLGIII